MKRLTSGSVRPKDKDGQMDLYLNSLIKSLFSAILGNKIKMINHFQVIDHFILF